ncbi:hypothetical protein JYT86_00645 [bacterium AH-315-N03]|nr:hypothetical protein [bacterium AH-315-N03]
MQIDRSLAVEAFLPQSSHVEQRWIFATGPAVPSELLVEIEVLGHATAPERDSRGLHFELPSGARVVYGHATWTGSDGRGEHIPAEWKGEHIALRVPAAVIGATEFPASLDPIIGPEIDPTTPVLSPSADSQVSPAVAWNGTEWLVAWTDSWRPSPAIRVSRISSSGVVLDPYGTEIWATQVRGRPDIAWTGSAWLVVWEWGGLSSNGVEAMRLSPTLTPLDPTPIRVTPARSSSPRYPSVACGGGECVIGYNRPSGFSARARRVGTDLSLLDAEFDPGSGTPTYDIDVAFLSGRFVLALSVWSTDLDIGVVRMLPGGTLLDAAPVIISGGTGDQDLSSIATDGTGFLVAFQNYQPVPGVVETRALRLDSAGALVGGSEIRVGRSTGYERYPSVAWNGTAYWVAWISAGRTTAVGVGEGARVNAAGALLDSTPIALAGSPSDRNAISVGGGPNALVVWTSDGSGEPLEARRWSPGGAAVDPTSFIVASAANQQVDPSIAFNGTNYLVVWTDYRDVTTTGADVYGARVDPSGALLDPAAIRISNAPGTQVPTSVASDGSGFLVTWTTVGPAPTFEVNISSARVAADGTVLDPAGISITSGAPRALGSAVSFGGGVYLVSWVDDRAGTQYAYATRVSPGGVVMDPGGFPVHTSDAVWSPLGAAAVGGTHLVAFRHASVFTSGRRVSSAGVVMDATPIGLVGGEYPSVTATATHFFAVGDRRLSSRNWRIESAAMDAATGAVTTEFYGTYEMYSHRPIVGWDGGAHVMVYRQVMVGAPGLADLMGRSLAATGVPLEAASTIRPFTSAIGLQGIAGAGGGVSGLVYSVLDPMTPYQAERVRFRTLRTTSGPLGASCAADADCSSGSCVDGVCCDTACGGGDLADCQACSIAAGASVDGTCAVAAGGTTCRGSRGDCDVEETCDGSAVSCPADALRDSSFVCRASAGACDAAEACDGTLDACPVDVAQPDGVACEDGLACNGGETCVAGACEAGIAPDCDDLDVCTLDSCAEPSGCSSTPIAGCGLPDAGVDAGSDAGVDAGSDAGVDSGRDAGPPMTEGAGCGCRAAPRGGGVGLSMLLALLLLLGRRRRRHG